MYDCTFYTTEIEIDRERDILLGIFCVNLRVKIIGAIKIVKIAPCHLRQTQAIYRRCWISKKGSSRGCTVKKHPAVRWPIKANLLQVW